jgi:phosphatidate cytidylyltransferase
MNASSAAPVRQRPFFRRGLSTAALWGAILALLFSGWRTGAIVLMAVFGLLAQWEFYHIQEEKGLRVFKKWGTFCGAVLYVACWYMFLHAPQYARDFHVLEEVLFVVLTVGVLFRLVVFPEPMVTPIVTVALTLFGFFYVPFLFSFLAQIAFRPDVPYGATFIILYVLAVTKFCDAGAYVVGSVLGRHKLIPRISPGKTWEGLAGGIAASVGISVALQHFFPAQFPGFTLRDAVVAGVLLALASVVGDLAESVVKRDARVKDSGDSIPGIGGILDLIDSLLFTAPVFFFYLRLLHIS